MPLNIKVRCANPNIQCSPIEYGDTSVAPWADHPALKIALDCLNIYDHWVAQRVIPIAMQWIEEHHEEVYLRIPQEKRDDVGAVIAAAFELMRTTKDYNAKYNEGLVLADRIKKGEVIPSKSNCNPMWAGVATGLHDHIANVFEQHEAVLRDMVSQTSAEAVPVG